MTGSTDTPQEFYEQALGMARALRDTTARHETSRKKAEWEVAVAFLQRWDTEEARDAVVGDRTRDHVVDPARSGDLVRAAADRDVPGVLTVPAGIARLRETAENATPGPWELLPCGCIANDDDDVVETQDCNDKCSRHEDAVFIAAWSPEVALAFLDYYVKRRALDEAEAAWNRTPTKSGEAFMHARAEFREAEARLLGLVGEDT